MSIGSLQNLPPQKFKSQKEQIFYKILKLLQKANAVKAYIHFCYDEEDSFED